MADPLPPTNLVTGLFGGTFDPIHLGHLALTRHLIQLGHVDQVVYIPAAVPPHKRHLPITSGDHRLAMVRLAIQDQPHCYVSDCELRAGGVSYTIDTVDSYLATFGPRLRLIIGMDSLRDLHLWYRADDLVDRCPLLIYARPGYPVPTPAELASRFGAERGARLAGAIVTAPESPISSTAVRDLCRRGKDPSTMVPAAVWRYIQANRLYPA